MFNFFLETFKLGVRNLHLHKLRSFLTTLGIIFGVVAVIAMVAIGEGTRQRALARMNALGATNIVIRSERPPESSEASARTSRVLTYGLLRTDMERLATLPHLKRIVAMRDCDQKVVRGDIRANANAYGTTPEVFDVLNLPLARGRYFNSVDYEAQAPVCVIGAGVAKQLFPYGDPLGEEIQIGTSGVATIICTIVGVLDPSGLRGEGSGVVNRDLDADVYFPLNLAQRAFGDAILKRQAGTFERKVIELSEIWMQIDEMENVEPVALLAENNVQNFHDQKDYAVKAPIQILRAAEEQNKMFNYFIVTIASFSLVVGGIGIMNIMLAAVTERTREIGIRRALGAKQRHITLQFLIETTVVSVSGGLIGIGLGVGVAKLIPWIAALVGADYPTSVATWSVIASFVFSGAIGIGFGLYPAITAARMNPIEALRHE